MNNLEKTEGQSIMNSLEKTEGQSIMNSLETHAITNEQSRDTCNH